MDFTDLINSVKEMITPGSTAIQTAPGQTYGPAVSRTTGVPISFKQMGAGDSGLYENRFSSMLGNIMPGNHGQIYIDPTSQDFQQTYKGNSAPVVQHEAAHAILESRFSDPDYTAMALNNPYYKQVAAKVDRDGYSPAEVPAYMSETGAAQRFGVPQNIVDLYRGHMNAQLQALDPATAAAFKSNLGK